MESIVLEVASLHLLGKVDQTLKLYVISTDEVILLEYLVEHVLQTILLQDLFKQEGIEGYKVELL